MDTLCYPVNLTEDVDRINVTFVDMPYGATYGEDKESALINAADCLEEIIASLMKNKQKIPRPSVDTTNPTVILSPTFSAKVLLYNTMNDQKVTKAELARRLNWKYPQVDRLFDTNHRSKLEQLVEAAAVLGKTYFVGMENSNRNVVRIIHK